MGSRKSKKGCHPVDGDDVRVKRSTVMTPRDMAQCCKYILTVTHHTPISNLSKGHRGSHTDHQDNDVCETDWQMFVDSVSIDKCLPQETLEAILGMLDRQTLCTARLVSKPFCAAASSHITSLTLTSPPQSMSLARFPRLEDVRVLLPVTDYSPDQLDPRLRAVMTHLTVSQHRLCMSIKVPKLPGMPKLRDLDMDNVNGERTRDWGDAYVYDAAVLHRLTNLEALRIGYCTPSVAMTITTATWLTSLAIGQITEEEKWSPADSSWLQHATNLRQLQALHIAATPEALPLIGNLTGLTGLTWLGASHDMEITDSISPLTRLSRLRSLDIDFGISESDLAIACSSGAGSLAKLRVEVSWDASPDCGRLLASQTALTELAVCGEQLCNLRHMGALRMESLQALEMFRLGRVDAEGCDALERATSLTRLCIGTEIKQPNVRLSRALGGLTQLRRLDLFPPGRSALIHPLALGPLTGLTSLHIVKQENSRMKIGDFRALLGLTGLRELYVFGAYLGKAMVPELAVLTNLSKLTLMSCDVTSLAPVTDVLNPLRQARGWPPVEAYPR